MGSGLKEGSAALKYIKEKNTKEMLLKEEKGIIYKKNKDDKRYVMTLFTTTVLAGAGEGIVIWKYDDEKKMFVTPIPELLKEDFNITQLAHSDPILDILSYNDTSIMVCLNSGKRAMEQFLKLWEAGKKAGSGKKIVKDKKLSTFSKFLKKEKKEKAESVGK